MKNVTQGTLTKLVFSFFLALLLAGPVFGNEAVPADTSIAPSAKVDTKIEKKAEKKGKRRHHKHSKKEDKLIEQAPVVSDAPAPVVEEKK